MASLTAQLGRTIQPQSSSRLHAHTHAPAVSRPVQPAARQTPQRQCQHQVIQQRTRASGCAVSRRWQVVARAELAADGPAPEEEDFDLLSNKVADLTKELNDELRGCSIYLIGMMGSGKSTVGRMLANTLKYAFFDTDHVIELAHKGETVADIFSNYGEDYFRKCESQVLRELAPYKNLVVATGGGAVTNPQNWGSMHNGIVAWLNGEPTLLAKRVLKDGTEKRPLLHADGTTGLEATAAKLNDILEKRRKFYQTADLIIPLEATIDTDADLGAPTAVVMYRLMQAMDRRIKETAREREAKRNFTIEYSSPADVPSMRMMQSPVADTREQQS